MKYVLLLTTGKTLVLNIRAVAELYRDLNRGSVLLNLTN